MNTIPRGWVSVDCDEMWDDRGWDVDEIERRVRTGNLCRIFNMNGGHIFESPEQHRRYLPMRKRSAAEYEMREREHCYYVGVPYRKVGKSREWDAIKYTLGVLWFIAQILVLPFALMGMRNGVQWMLGTGERKGD